MKTSKNGNVPIRRVINQAVGKPIDSGPAKLPPDNLILEWVLLNCHKFVVDGMDELGPQPRLLTVIPIGGFGKFDLGLGRSISARLTYIAPAAEL
jgi:hypothetical protein